MWWESHMLNGLIVTAQSASVPQKRDSQQKLPFDIAAFFSEYHIMENTMVFHGNMNHLIQYLAT